MGNMYQPRDHYFQKAKREGYPARSVYKLEEIDGKYKLLKTGYRVLDLGCAPGSWLQYCAERVGEKGLVVGIDSVPLSQKVAPHVHFIQRDVSRLDPAEITAFCPAFNLVLSDLAPSTSGVKSLDQDRSLQLVYSSWELARQLLRPGGDYLAKIFQGVGVKGFLEELKRNFTRVKTVKPKTSGRSRLEIYVLAQGKLKG